jgi:hypothetical protein
MPLSMYRKVQVLRCSGCYASATPDTADHISILGKPRAFTELVSIWLMYGISLTVFT